MSETACCFVFGYCLETRENRERKLTGMEGIKGIKKNSWVQDLIYIPSILFIPVNFFLFLSPNL
jgi:hypothetical protein